MEGVIFLSNGTSCLPNQEAIDGFPSDFLSQDQRIKGGILIHFFIVIYACCMMVIVCESYFMPALEVISRYYNIPADVSGATLMALGSSSTELFTSITGLFVAKSNIGISTILGSAVFNFLGVTSVAGLSLKRKKIHIDSYPVTRETILYLVCLAALVATVSDGKIQWFEGAIMIFLYLAYVIFIVINPKLEKYFQNKFSCGPQPDSEQLIDEVDGLKIGLPFLSRKTRKRRFLMTRDETDSQTASNPDEQPCPWVMPQSGIYTKIIWVILWPAMFSFAVTIPDARKEADRIFVPIAFVMCLVWIGAISYLCVWMVTIIGYTLGIPDEIAGLTILAAGVSLPEIIFGVYGIQKGEANMVLATQVGSNIFDILICLGLPWTISALAFNPNGEILIENTSLVFTVAMLFGVTVLFWVTFWIGRWIMDWKIGLLCLVFYLAFLVITCLYKFNLIGNKNIIIDC